MNINYLCEYPNKLSIFAGGGLIIGGVVSYIFCNRKKWPMALASGFAVGMAYCNCERDLNLSVAPSCNPTPKVSVSMYLQSNA